MRIKSVLSIAALFLALAISACGGIPKHSQKREDAISSIVFKNGAEGAIVLLDGREIGRLKGNQTTFKIEDGTHHLEVVSGGTSIYDDTLFIQDGTKKVISLQK